MMYKALGVIAVALPFTCLFVMAGKMVGWFASIVIFGAGICGTLLMVVGIGLIVGAIPTKKA